jgi:hypothetical protein
MKWAAPISLTIALAAMGVPVAACLWDHDTLRAEARGLPGLAEVITGRFERNPPLYYEMRLERAARDIEGNPHAWEAYDNAGVACDRLGRHDDAIEWMSRKRAAMDVHAGGENLKDHEYRYLANLGTFYAHRWFARGADRTDLADMDRAEAYIAQAIQLNPDAHFGRERYQLMAMRWILNPPAAALDDDGSMEELPSLFLAHDGFRALRETEGERPSGDLARAGLHDAVEGLAGLIALGNAWESVDVFHALALALNDQGDSAMSYLAQLRCRELIAAGRTSLHPASAAGDALLAAMQVPGYLTTEEGAIESYFADARAAADEWHEHRTEFMMAKLAAGAHPDTDPAFWSGFVEIRAVSLPNGLLGLGSHRAATLRYVIGVCAAAAILLAIAIYFFRRHRARSIAAVSPLR